MDDKTRADSERGGIAEIGGQAMTREEAIVYFESLLKRFEEMRETETSYWGKAHTETTIEATRLALTALRPVSRERVEKAEWIWSTGDVYICSSCGEKTHVDECMGTPIYNFCPFCMAPMTDEAVDMVLKR